jgi:hypothetical protein
MELGKEIYERTGLTGKPFRSGGRKHAKERFSMYSSTDVRSTLTKYFVSGGIEPSAAFDAARQKRLRENRLGLCQRSDSVDGMALL